MAPLLEAMVAPENSLFNPSVVEQHTGSEVSSQNATSYTCVCALRHCVHVLTFSEDSDESVDGVFVTDGRK